MIDLREAIYYAVREDFNALIALDRGEPESFIDCSDGNGYVPETSPFLG